jgi:hypothetical protein
MSLSPRYARRGSDGAQLFLSDGGGCAVTEPGTHDHSYEPVEESPEEILSSAKPFPPFEEMVIEDLTEDEDRVFLETIFSA